MSVIAFRTALNKNMSSKQHMKLLFKTLLFLKIVILRLYHIDTLKQYLLNVPENSMLKESCNSKKKCKNKLIKAIKIYFLNKSNDCNYCKFKQYVIN